MIVLQTSNLFLPNEIILDAFSGAKIISNIGHDETGDFH